MRTLWRPIPRRDLLVLIVAPAIVLAVTIQAAYGGASRPDQARSRRAPATAWQRPRYANTDCNNPYSVYRRLKPTFWYTCADPVHVSGDRYTRFTDDGYYVGHDEPQVRFISNAPGSGNTMTYYMRLPVDPARKPTASGSVTISGELTVPWFGLEVCDPLSYPQQPCTPDSDLNLGGSQRTAAGSALLELQFYPPGFAPFLAGGSCGVQWWCGVLSIDSLECTFDMKYCNPNCMEVPNFAFLQTNGVPTGGPGPGDMNANSLVPNADTLRMYPGDLLRVSITDPPAGLTTSVADLTTGKTGYMIASAANGFEDTRVKDCSTRPWTFHAEYSSARQQNLLPWLSGDGGVLMTQELGHFDSCSRVVHKVPRAQAFVSAEWATCAGGVEGAGKLGPGPCRGKSFFRQRCVNPEAQGRRGPAGCRTNRLSFKTLCEFTGSFCQPRGTRASFSLNGKKFRVTAPVSYCEPDDLDFDGQSYLSRSWPDGAAAHPTPLQMAGPFSNGGAYPTVQFETDVGGFERLCQIPSGRDCRVAPLGARFYPYWTLGPLSPPVAALDLPFQFCSWDFGKAIAHYTIRSLRGDRQYGHPDHRRFVGTFISQPRPNPAISGPCSPSP